MEAAHDCITNSSQITTLLIYVIPYNDPLIEKMLTCQQLKHVQDLVEKLNVRDKGKLGVEIQYCVNKKSHLTGCGQEFIKKINDIRIVVGRGGW